MSNTAHVGDQKTPKANQSIQKVTKKLEDAKNE